MPAHPAVERTRRAERNPLRPESGMWECLIEKGARGKSWSSLAWPCGPQREACIAFLNTMRSL